MKTEQVIQIDELGRISGLVHRKGLDITKFRAKNIHVERASDIKYCSANQKWTIKYLIPPYQGKLATYEDLDKNSKTKGVMYFSEYDDAVKVEIELFNKFRKAGLLK